MTKASENTIPVSASIPEAIDENTAVATEADMPCCMPAR